MEKLADSGCDDGREALASLCRLSANEAAGIHGAESSINSARDTLKNIENMISIESGLPEESVFHRENSTVRTTCYRADMTEGTSAQIR